MKRIGIILLIISAVIIQLSCRPNICCDPHPPYKNTGKLYLSVKHNGVAYPDSLLDKLVLSYFNKGYDVSNPNHDPDKPSYIMYGDYKLYEVIGDGVIVSDYAISAALRSNIREFYLQYPDGSKDTLLISLNNIADADTAQTPCKCNAQITSITIDGNTLQSVHNNIESYMPDNDIYIIEK